MKLLLYVKSQLKEISFQLFFKISIVRDGALVCRRRVPNRRTEKRKRPFSKSCAQQRNARDKTGRHKGPSLLLVSRQLTCTCSVVSSTVS